MSSKGKSSTVVGGGAALVPKLRFSEFRDAAEWQEKSLSSFLTPVARDRKKPSEGYKGLGLRSHGKGTFLKEQEDPAKNSMDTLYEVKRDDLIVNITFAWEGAIAIAGSTDDGALVSHRFPTYTFSKDRTLPEFFKFKIVNKQFVYKLGLISPGGAGRNRVMSKADFLELKVFLPKLDEQKKIADCLDTVDALIAAQGRKVEALKAHKKGLMQQLFPQEGETQPRLRFPEFEGAGEWEEVPLIKLVGGLDAGVSVKSGDRPAMSSEIGVLKTSAVTSGVFSPLENKVVFDETQISRVKEPVQGDTIIISRMNTPALVGASAYVKVGLPNIFLPDRLWAAKKRRGTSMRFLAFFLGSDKGRAALSSLAGGSSGSMKNIAKKDVLALLLAVPSPPEQQRIADCLTSLDDLIAAETRKLETLVTHKQGLMQQLFPRVGDDDA